MSPREKQRSREFVALQRSQLDSQLTPDTPVGELDIPARGWIHAIRTALGMSQKQLGRRLEISAASVSTLEKREASGSVTVATLGKAAEALDCDLRVAFIPRKGLQRAVEDQAARKAGEERNRVVHTMRMEDQDSGVEQSLSEGFNAESWLNERAREIWD